ncbi:unnamed protein product [Rotaria sp. Silwood1]|nr:unnamed protein product [Rotaria sp. Silwood1]CAF3763949.1 unnamed protein product [Rotaria sp. Silwood1]CAF4929869.1 unnamed protein product [Rotaria sp. Silwood1]CAF4933393.1 unnamed protein product [Rotaria sp. Silwood1]
MLNSECVQQGIRLNLHLLYTNNHFSKFPLKLIHDRQSSNSYFIQQQSSTINSSSIQRAILIFYPSNQEINYLPEIRWLYRSWIEMIKYEPSEWRTDFIIFTEQYSTVFIQLGCLINRIRLNDEEQPKCRVFIYVRISARHIDPVTKQQILVTNHSEKNLFHVDISRSILLYDHFKAYQYIDSVNIIAEGYPIYSYYDFILKTDLDVFITKRFANYVPSTLKTLFTGRGGYSTEFNTRRLGRIARDMGWKYQNLTNIGSTWYGSPYVAQRIANLTLDAMVHLSMNEFCTAEREQKLSTLLWPDWHYGVLSMYGTHLAVNHLINSEKLDIQNGSELLDQSTTNNDKNDIEKNNRLHLHCWHTDAPFSKFQFKAKKYDHIPPHILINDSSSQSYAMRMALESRLMTFEELSQQLREISRNKTHSSIFIAQPNSFTASPIQ